VISDIGIMSAGIPKMQIGCMLRQLNVPFAFFPRLHASIALAKYCIKHAAVVTHITKRNRDIDEISVRRC